MPGLSPSTLKNAIEYAKAAFEYRQEVIGFNLPCNPDWQGFMFQSIAPALAGERGSTHQEQCAYQAIRLAIFETGNIQQPWTKAFMPIVIPIPQTAAIDPPAIPISWYRRYWLRIVGWYRQLKEKINDLV